MTPLRQCRAALAAAFLAALAGIAGPAGASTITLGYANPGSDSLRATLTCTLGCEAWFIGAEDYAAGNWGAGGWNRADGTILNRNLAGRGQDNRDATRLTIANTALGTGLTAADRSETRADAGLADGWTSSAEVLLVWIGNQDGFRYALIRNLAADNTFRWTGQPGGAGGISGYDGFGVIPLPAAGWLLLSGLGALVLVRRRRPAPA